MTHNEWNKAEILMPEKGPPVFLDYDQAALDAAYDQAAYAPNREQLIKRPIRDSERVRHRIGELERIAYGSAEIKRLDLYRVRRKLAPVFIFIHGGAWRSGRSKEFAAPAEMFLAAGAHYVVPDFAWVQDVGATWWFSPEESPELLRMHNVSRHPLLEVMRDHWMALLTAAGVAAVTSWRADMRQNIDKLAEGIAHIEAAYAPGLVDGSVFDRKAGRVHRFQCGIDVIHLDRKIGNGPSRAAFACDADLNRHVLARAVGRGPAKVHHDVKAEHVVIEALRRLDVASGDVADNSSDLHSVRSPMRCTV